MKKGQINIYVATTLLRFTLGVSFLSAVADRFGLWGAPGSSPTIAWGNFENFVTYTQAVNAFMPSTSIGFLAWSATLFEIALGLGLIFGVKTKWMAILSGLLLTSFAVTMYISFGVKAPLNYSVFSAAAGAFALAVLSELQSSKKETEAEAYRRNQDHR